MTLKLKTEKTRREYKQAFPADYFYPLFNNNNAESVREKEINGDT